MKAKIFETKEMARLVSVPQEFEMDPGERPDWDSFFMAMAYFVSTRSSCWDRKVGAIIVRDKTVIATGFNGAPKGIDDCLGRGECLRNKRGVEGPGTKDYENCYASHAEVNAIANSASMGGASMNGATLYTVAYPCTGCAKLIINAGIKKIVYSEGHRNYTKLSSQLLKEAAVEEVKIPKNEIVKTLYKSLTHLLIRDEDGQETSQEEKCS